MKTLCKTNSILSLTLAALVGCGGGGDVAQEEEPPVPDTTAPTVVSVNPADGATGVYADAEIVIVFSEAMDAATVNATLDTAELGEVSMSWNDALDTLTIHPDAPLEYAMGQGIDPTSVTANTYTVVLGNAAQDLAGNGLGTGVSTTFSTLKEMSETFELDNDESWTMGPVDMVSENDADFQIGDHASKLGIRSTMTFDIDLLPETAAEVTEATLATRQLPGGIQGQPYADLASNLLIDHVTFPSLVDEVEANIIATYNSPASALANLGDFATSADQVVIQKDVTTAVADDLVNRADRNGLSQFILYFADETDDDVETDSTVISRGLSELQVTYLVP